MSSLSPATSRFSAVSLLLLIILFVVFYLLVPLGHFYIEKNETLENLQQQLSRFEYLVANEDKINAELKRIDDLGSEGDLFLSGSKKSIASANLREFINEAVKRSGGQLVSSQDYEADVVPSATAIGLRLQVSGEAQNLVDFLHQIESARPIIFIDDLSVTSSSSRVRASRSRRKNNIPLRKSSSLDVRMDVVGYLAGEKK
ncbi:MAG: type II secretion system protein GspM [Porticoccus sp.]